MVVLLSDVSGTNRRKSLMLSDVPQSPLYDLGHRYEPEYKNPYLAVGLDWGYDWL